MAHGTIEFDTLTTSGQIESRTTGLSIDTDYIVHGINKAWLHSSGDGTTINDSLNIASLTDTGTGIQTPAITNVFVNTSYSYLTSSQITTTSGTGVFFDNAASQTTSTISWVHYQNAAAADATKAQFGLIGELA